MPEFLTPGVFIQEVEFGPQPIEGVSTSTAGFVGEAERGPVSGPPTLVTSFPDFVRNFGGFVEGKALAYAVRGFFDNGGKRAFVVRVAHSTVTPAARTVLGRGSLVRLLGPSNPGVSPAPSTLTLSSVVGLEIGANKLTLINIKTGATTPLAVQDVNGATGVVTLTAPAVSVSPADDYAQITATPSSPSTVLSLKAKYPGFFGNRIAVLVEPHYVNSAVVRTRIDTTHIVLAAVDFLKPGSKIELEISSAALTRRQIATVRAIDAANNTVTLAAPVTPDYSGGKAYLIGWRTTVLFDGAVVETLSGLSSALDPSSVASEFEAELKAKSNWILSDPATARIDPEHNLLPTFALANPVLLVGATTPDASPDATEVVGSDIPPRKGLKALEAQKEVNIIAAPGFTTKGNPLVSADNQAVVSELIGQAERTQDRFAVFESSDPLQATSVLNERGNYNSRYAAMYHPWITMLDPLSKTEILMPPSGHVMGAYARTDNERGVFKAPANVVLRSITGFSRDVPDGEQDLLNPKGVNVLRHFDGLGNVIWGARTISAEGLWKYVPVRRLFIFLEQSIIKGTRYAVFEPNDLGLWARLRDSLTNFLTSQWRAGALFGRVPEEAFFVKVDETTTTQDDRDNGRVNILVGIAPVKPAEFIVFQIGQAPGSVIIAERG